MNAIAPQSETAIIVELADLADSPYQKPRVSKRGNLEELAASVAEVGVLEPLLARKRTPTKATDAHYELVAGHRRKLAAGIAKLTHVPVIVREYTDDQVLELAKKSEINIYAISLRPQHSQDRQRQAFSQAEYLLNALTRETGGRAYFPTSIGELESVYDRIAEELRTLYSVGYVSSNLRRDGKWRRIVVRVPDREGLQIRHKLGYYAPPG